MTNLPTYNSMVKTSAGVNLLYATNLGGGSDLNCCIANSYRAYRRYLHVSLVGFFVYVTKNNINQIINFTNYQSI